MGLSRTTGDDLTMLRDDITALRRDIANLAGHTTSDAVAGVQSTANTIGDGAQRLLRGLAGDSEHAAAVVAKQIDLQPLVAALIAVGIGFLGGRLLSR